MSGAVAVSSLSTLLLVVCKDVQGKTQASAKRCI